MHFRSIAAFVLCLLLAAFVFFFTALVVWPGREGRGLLDWPIAIVLASWSCAMLTVGAGGLEWLGLASAPFVFLPAASLARRSRRGDDGEDDAELDRKLGLAAEQPAGQPDEADAA
jgi:hypothetical protein